MSVVDAFGKFVALNNWMAGSPVRSPNEIDGTTCWLSIHRSPCVNVDPKAMLWPPFVQVSVSSMIRVEASRAWYVAVVPVKESRLYNALLPVQHAVARFR